MGRTVLGRGTHRDDDDEQTDDDSKRGTSLNQRQAESGVGAVCVLGHVGVRTVQGS